MHKWVLMMCILHEGPSLPRFYPLSFLKLTLSSDVHELFIKEKQKFCAKCLLLWDLMHFAYWKNFWNYNMKIYILFCFRCRFSFSKRIENYFWCFHIFFKSKNVSFSFACFRCISFICFWVNPVNHMKKECWKFQSKINCFKKLIFHCLFHPARIHSVWKRKEQKKVRRILRTFTQTV